MQVSVNTVSGLERRIEVAVPAERLTGEIETRLRQIARTARLKGFRPGKAPLPVVRQQFAQQVQSEVVGDLLRQSYVEAVSQKNLRPAGDPRIERLSAEPGQDLRYVALIEVVPEITLQPLSGLVLERYQAEITEADVDAMVESMRRQQAQFQPVDRESREGDQITVDFEGKVGGETFQGGSGSNAKFVLGTGRVLPDFEFGLLGMKAGESKNILVQFPADYGVPSLAGMTAFFDVTVKEVGESRLPEVDEQFCAAFGIAEGGVAALKEAVRSSMQNELDYAVRNRVRNQVLDKIYEANPIEVPNTMIEDAVQEIREETLRRIGRENISQLPENESLQSPARKRAAMRLLLGELTALANLTLDRGQVGIKLDELIGDRPDADDVRRQYMQNADLMRRVEASVMEEQLMDWIIGQASVREVPATFGEITGFGRTGV